MRDTNTSDRKRFVVPFVRSTYVCIYVCTEKIYIYIFYGEAEASPIQIFNRGRSTQKKEREND